MIVDIALPVFANYYELAWFIARFGFIYPIALIFVGYVIGIQYERPTIWMWVRVICAIIAFFTAILDFFANWIQFTILFFQLPKRSDGTTKTEWTISDRVNRTCLEGGIRGFVSLAIGKLLNVFSYGNVHCPNANTKALF
jgi:hypothetical protein